MKLSEIELDFLYEKSAELFRDKVKQEIFNYWAAQSRNQIHDQLFHQLIEHTHIDFPQDFLKRWMS